MRLTVSETAKLTGVSVRTLHYYDEIGLLTPSLVMQNNYRYYDDKAIERLQQILFFRELDFPLKEIVEIMNNPEYSKEQALKNQKELLQLKRARLDQLIQLLDANLKGENTMSFEQFDMTNINQAKEKYAKEVKERWGNTNAYEECHQKQKGYTKQDWSAMMKASDEILQKFSTCLGESPSSEKVQSLVEEWKNYITKYHYTCTNEILSGLGQMYTADERFTKNMDKFQPGTTQLISDAIEIYCKGK